MYSNQCSRRANNFLACLFKLPQLILPLYLYQVSRFRNTLICRREKWLGRDMERRKWQKVRRITLENMEILPPSMIGILFIQEEIETKSKLTKKKVHGRKPGDSSILHTIRCSVISLFYSLFKVSYMQTREISVLFLSG